jgi:hypothetical protein
MPCVANRPRFFLVAMRAQLNDRPFGMLVSFPHYGIFLIGALASDRNRQAEPDRPSKLPREPLEIGRPMGCLLCRS